MFAFNHHNYATWLPIHIRYMMIIIINTLFKVDITTKLVKNKIAHYKLLVRLIKVNYHILNILKMLKM